MSAAHLLIGSGASISEGVGRQEENTPSRSRTRNLLIRSQTPFFTTPDVVAQQVKALRKSVQQGSLAVYRLAPDNANHIQSVANKRCVKCGEAKPLTAFYRDKRGRACRVLNPPTQGIKRPGRMSKETER